MSRLHFDSWREKAADLNAALGFAVNRDSPDFQSQLFGMGINGCSREEEEKLWCAHNLSDLDHNQ